MESTVVDDTPKGLVVPHLSISEPPILTVSAAVKSIASALATLEVSDNSNLVYGTSGFRANASILPPVLHKCGLLAALHSLSSKKQVTGICITASHNPEEDNGAKLVAPSGGMVDSAYEDFAVRLVNSNSPLDVFLELIASHAATDFSDSSESENPFRGCVVYVASDSRPSSPSLAKIVKDAVRSTGAAVVDYGFLTTPQLHWLILKANSTTSLKPLSIKSYETEITDTFLQIFDRAGIQKRSMDKLIMDCSNGVTAKAAAGAFPFFPLNKVGIKLQIRNCQGAVNLKCGSDVVQRNKIFPINFFTGVSSEYVTVPSPSDSFATDGSQDFPWLRCCAVDGDGDRIVYFTMNESKKLVVFDGDKISVLLALTIRKMLRNLASEKDVMHADIDSHARKPLRIGVVYTAFANSSAIHTLQELAAAISTETNNLVSLNLDCAKTGVKHLHAKAGKYDIGIYFESNGHGTILSDMESVLKWADSARMSLCRSFQVLKGFLELFNPSTGDAMTDLLAVEASLAYLGMNLHDWNALYKEYPCVQLQIPMNRELLDQFITPPDNEARLLQPSSIQDSIDDATRHVKRSRVFCRASGTENVLRIYVEACESEDVSRLSTNICDEVKAWASVSSKISVSVGREE